MTPTGREWRLLFCGARPEVLFDGIEEVLWDVSSDGQFFVTVKKREPPKLNVIQNFFEELKRRVPN